MKVRVCTSLKWLPIPLSLTKIEPYTIPRCTPGDYYKLAFVVSVYNSVHLVLEYNVEE